MRFALYHTLVGSYLPTYLPTYFVSVSVIVSGFKFNILSDIFKKSLYDFKNS